MNYHILKEIINHLIGPDAELVANFAPANPEWITIRARHSHYSNYCHLYARDSQLNVCTYAAKDVSSEYVKTDIMLELSDPQLFQKLKPIINSIYEIGTRDLQSTCNI